MRGLVPYAWRHLVARPARTLLTAFGIAIGVAVLVATLAVNAGLEASIDRQVDALIGRADIRVAAFTETGLTDRTLAAVEGVPGVALVAPATERRTYLAAGSGRLPTTQPVTVLGVDLPRERRVRDLAIVRGTPPDTLGPTDALITERLAASDGLDVGSEITVLGAGAPVKATVAGILAGDGPVPAAGGRTVVLGLQAATALNRPDGTDPATDGAIAGLSRIDVVLAAGADRASTIAALERALTVEPYVLSTPEDVAASLGAATADIRSTMALLAAISLFAAAFVILNTLAMTVAERVRELGLLRAAGARRAQVVEVVVAQALLLGTLGSVLGLVAGVVLAQLAAAWLRTSGGAAIDGPAITAPTLVAGLVAGLAITLVAALEPARRAASISPVAALRARADGATAVRAHASWLIAIVVLVGALAALLLPPTAGSGAFPLRAVAVYLVLLFAVLVTPAVLGPLGRVAGLPFAGPLRLEERLARAAIARDRGPDHRDDRRARDRPGHGRRARCRGDQRPRGRDGLAGRGRAGRRDPDGDRPVPGRGRRPRARDRGHRRRDARDADRIVRPRVRGHAPGRRRDPRRRLRGGRPARVHRRRPGCRARRARRRRGGDPAALACRSHRRRGGRRHRRRDRDRPGGAQGRRDHRPLVSRPVRRGGAGRLVRCHSKLGVARRRRLRDPATTRPRPPRHRPPSPTSPPSSP